VALFAGAINLESMTTFTATTGLIASDYALTTGGLHLVTGSQFFVIGEK